MENKKRSDRVQMGAEEGQIVCRVQNCAYHHGECTCTANRIAVGPTYASSGKDTVCATFKPKEF